MHIEIFLLPDWLNCKKGLLGGYNKVHGTVKPIVSTIMASEWSGFF